MSPQKHKYHYLRERERIRQDPRLEGLWHLGNDIVSVLQEYMARLWPQDTFVKAQAKRGIQTPLHWFLTQQVKIDYSNWNQNPILWRTWANAIESASDTLTLAQMSEAAELLDLIHSGTTISPPFINLWKNYIYRDLLGSNFQTYRQVRRILIADFLQYSATHPIRNYLLVNVLARRSEPLMGMGYQGGGNFPVPLHYPNGWKKHIYHLNEAEQQALVRETARFLDYALPVLEERFGIETALQLLNDDEQGMLNFWLLFHSPEIARSVKSDFQKYFGHQLIGIHPRMPIKRLPLVLLCAFGTEASPWKDVAHVCRGGSLRDLPSIQMPEIPGKTRLSPRAAHILGQRPACNPRDYFRELYCATCLAVWPNDAVALAVARFVEEQIGHGNYNDPIMKELMLFFKRNETELPGIRLGHLIDYLYHKKMHRPDFSLKGRTIRAMLRRMEEWHRELGQLREIQGKDSTWRPSGIQPHSQKQGDQITFVFVEICTQAELIDEGRIMRHCVASYIDGCISGQYSIWSLRKTSPSGTERLLTIQVNAGQTIIQACGPCNEPPSRPERTILNNWARAEHLKIDYRD